LETGKCSEITVVHDKRQMAITVDVRDDVRELRVSFRAVRHVANQREGEALLAVCVIVSVVPGFV